MRMEGLYFSWEINKPHLHQIYCTESWLMSISSDSSLAFSHPGWSHKRDKTKQSSDIFIWYYRDFIRDICCGVGVLTSENAADKSEAWLFFSQYYNNFSYHSLIYVDNYTVMQKHNAITSSFHLSKLSWLKLCLLDYNLSRDINQFSSSKLRFRENGVWIDMIGNVLTFGVGIVTVFAFFRTV